MESRTPTWDLLLEKAMATAAICALWIGMSATAWGQEHQTVVFNGTEDRYRAHRAQASPLLAAARIRPTVDQTLLVGSWYGTHRKGGLENHWHYRISPDGTYTCFLTDIDHVSRQFYRKTTRGRWNVEGILFTEWEQGSDQPAYIIIGKLDAHAILYLLVDTHLPPNQWIRDTDQRKPIVATIPPEYRESDQRF